VSTPAPQCSLYLQAIGLAAPGLSGWAGSLEVLRGAQPYTATELPSYSPNLLPPNERRRASRAVCAAFRVAEEAVQDGDASRLATVFSSADGDQYITERICRALTAPERMLSPTDFHHSVHNAPAGNWSIAAAARGPSTALAAWRHGFAAGLAESACMVAAEGHDTLLVAYDLAAPAFLRSRSCAQQPFAVALRFAASSDSGALARLTVSMAIATPSACVDPQLEAVRLGNPAAYCLPLLQAIAARDWGTLQFALGDEVDAPGLRVDVAPVPGCNE